MARKINNTKVSAPENVEAAKKCDKAVDAEIKPDRQLKLLFVASECQPFVATGGLGDVMGSLPHTIKKVCDNCDVRVMLPLYGDIKQDLSRKSVRTSRLA